MRYASMIKTAVIAAGALLGSAAAQAQEANLETFATYTQASSGSSVHWQKSAGGTGGRLYTLNSLGAEGAAAVRFEYLLDDIAFLGPLNASFTMNLIAPEGNGIPGPGGTSITQEGLSGSFSFIYTGTSSFTIGTETYSTGANLLSGIIGGAYIDGRRNASSAGDAASTEAGSTIEFTSDVLDFTDVRAYDFAQALTQITPRLNASAGQSLNSFSAASTGSFSAEPPPSIIGLQPVPEAATWAMMLMGFGAIGGALRSRRPARQLLDA